MLNWSAEDLAHHLEGSGLERQRATRILAILHRIKGDFGRFDLQGLGQLDPSAAEAYLTSLPGVGLKTAKCVQLFSLGTAVLPVDGHLLRVARRLKLLPRGLSRDRSERRLEALVPAKLRRAFHINAITLGREVCRPVRPRCEECPLVSLCPFPLAG